MKQILRKLSVIFVIISTIAMLAGCGLTYTLETTRKATIPTFMTTITEETSTSSTSATSAATEGSTSQTAQSRIDESGSFTRKDDVALYIYTYGHLPSNFITKKEAKKLGWSSGGLDNYIYGACIGGDRFGNYEENLPEKSGRVYYECDIDTMHQRSRGAKRIVFSSDGLIYYTEDHYSSFELLYGSP